MVTVKLDKNQNLILATEYKFHPWDNIIWWHSNCSQNEIQVHKQRSSTFVSVSFTLSGVTQLGEGSIYMALLCCGSSEKKSEQEIKQGKNRTRKELLIPLSSRMIFPGFGLHGFPGLLFYWAQFQQPKDGTTNNGLGLGHPS